MDELSNECYVPAIVCAEYDSPIDALIGLCVPQGEAMDLVTASWRNGEACLLATIDGGRAVAAIRTPAGRWAACNVFPEYGCPTRKEAERQLGRLLKRGRKGFVAELASGFQLAKKPLKA